jgi:archaellin
MRPVLTGLTVLLLIAALFAATLIKPSAATQQRLEEVTNER